MRKSVRILTGLFCLLFVAILLTSGALTLTHSQHECTVDNCSVCALLSGWTQLLRGMTVAALLLCAAYLAQFTAVKATSARMNAAPTATLVSRKVKLSN